MQYTLCYVLASLLPISSMGEAIPKDLISRQIGNDLGRIPDPSILTNIMSGSFGDTQAIPDFNVADFSGIWYEAATSIIPRLSFESGCDCTQLIYKISNKNQDEPVDSNSDLNVLTDGGSIHKLVLGEENVILRGSHACQRYGSTIFGKYFKFTPASEIKNKDPTILANGQMFMAMDTLPSGGFPVPFQVPHLNRLNGNYWIVALGKVDATSDEIPTTSDEAQSDKSANAEKTSKPMLDGSVDNTKNAAMAVNDGPLSDKKDIVEMNEADKAKKNEQDSSFAIVVAPPIWPVPTVHWGIWVLVRNPELASSPALWDRVKIEAKRLGWPKILAESPFLVKTNQDPTICNRFWRT